MMLMRSGNEFPVCIVTDILTVFIRKDSSFFFFNGYACYCMLLGDCKEVASV